MGIKRRVLIFVILFGISAGSALIIFNQLMLKNSLTSYPRATDHDLGKT